MDNQLRNGFRVGEWDIRPIEGQITGRRGTFQLEPKVMDVLVCLSANAGNVTERHTLINEVWGSKSAISDEPLTRCIASLRKKLGDDPHKPDYIQTVPKRGYRLVCSVTSVSASSSLKKRIGLTASSVLLVVMMLIASNWYPVPDDSLKLSAEGSMRSEVLPNSVAVLPFSNLSGDPEQEYFSDGITEEISAALAQVAALHVTSRTSTFSLKGVHGGILAIANRLGVAYIVDGSVRRSGETIRISAQLIEVAGDRQVWSVSYDRQFDDIFALQDEISRTVVNKLQTALKLEPARVEHLQDAMISADAYELYLRGLHLFYVGTVEARLRAERHFLDAIKLEPKFADAWYRLARTRFALPKPKYATAVTVLAAANAAINLNPKHGGAHTLVSIVAPLWNREKLELRARAMEMSPNDPWVVLNYGRALEWNYRIYEADGYFREAINLDPLNLETLRIYGLFNMYRGRSEKALGIFERIIALNPGYAPAHQHRSRVFSEFRGNMVSAKIEMDKAMRIDPETVDGLLGSANIYFALGDLLAAGEIVERIANSGTDAWRVGAYEARYRYLLGEHDNAVRIARNVFAAQGPGFTHPVLMTIVVRDMIANGRLEAAEDFLLTYEPDFDRLFTGPMPRTRLELTSRLVTPQFASMLHHVYVLQGKTAQAADLAERIRTDDLRGALTRDFEPTAASFHTEALKQMRDGHYERALDALRAAVRAGYRIGYQQLIRDHPIFQALQTYSEFQEILKTIEDDMDAQRRVLSSIAGNQQPAIT